jgi:hypothetical protein
MILSRFDCKLGRSRNLTSALFVLLAKVPHVFDQILGRRYHSRAASSLSTFLRSGPASRRLGRQALIVTPSLWAQPSDMSRTRKSIYWPRS